MQKRIEVLESYIEQQQLYLIAQPFKTEGKEIRDTAQMITDSDNVSFIYIIDINDEFVYVSIPVNIWGNLKGALENNYDVCLKLNDRTVKLDGFLSELTYLIENIEGNANYGEHMVSKVEEVFLTRKSEL
ncbi:hypothetical protein ACFOU2_13260 [Bacillus songklensis]|uniref:Uncharacterized protein n=1 Tax=Bacillus songklensis TaxID=1069116 RepID=A0ABV8B2A2_9BACI